MPFELPPLPYARNALEPYISERTLHFHYDKHHKGYVDQLNAAMEGRAESGSSLEKLITALGPGKPFNFAAQAWNHAFYWRCMSANGGGKPNGELAKQIRTDFRSVNHLKEALAEAAKDEFGSGWAWLVGDGDGGLRVLSTTDAENPLQSGLEPLLTIDVWEHAYYLDYQHERAKYLEGFLDHLLDWDFVADNFMNWKSKAG